MNWLGQQQINILIVEPQDRHEPHIASEILVEGEG
jgi:hypothetical protein